MLSFFRTRVVDWRPVPQVNSLLLTKLPSDVFLYLLERIPPADRAALALSCKTILLKLGQPQALPQIFRQLLHWKLDRLSLLSRLEVHFPHHVLCYQCAFFHRRREVSRCRPFQPTWCDRCNGEASDIGLNLHCARIPFVKAQEVMNRYRYGVKYGCPITDLEFNAWHIWTADPTRSSCALRIVNGELIMKLDQSVLILKTDLANVSRNDGRFSVWGSWHGRLSRVSYIKMFREEMRKEGSNSLFVRCKLCSTECRFVLDETHSREYAEARHTSWRNLGACNNPFDKKWLMLDCSPKDWDVRRINPADSLYSAHFDDDMPPSHSKTKWCPLLYGNNRVE